jgi:hypothetical protein
MSSAGTEQANTAWLTRRFPRHVAHLRTLAAADETFAGLCADYELARSCLERLSAPAGQPMRPEVAEYRTIIAELEAEIMRSLEGLPGTPDCGASATAPQPKAIGPARRPGQPIFYRDPLTKLRMLHWLEPGDRVPLRIYDGMDAADRALLAADQLPHEAG